MKIFKNLVAVLVILSSSISFLGATEGDPERAEGYQRVSTCMETAQDKDPSESQMKDPRASSARTPWKKYIFYGVLGMGMIAGSVGLGYSWGNAGEESCAVSSEFFNNPLRLLLVENDKNLTSHSPQAFDWSIFELSGNEAHCEAARACEDQTFEQFRNSSSIWSLSHFQDNETLTLLQERTLYWSKIAFYKLCAPLLTQCAFFTSNLTSLVHH